MLHGISAGSVQSRKSVRFRASNFPQQLPKVSFEEFIGDDQRLERPANIATARHSVKFAQAVKSSREHKIKTPAGTTDRGKHVDDERRTVLRPVVPQGPCVLIEPDCARTLKII